MHLSSTDSPGTQCCRSFYVHQHHNNGCYNSLSIYHFIISFNVRKENQQQPSKPAGRYWWTEVQDLAVLQHTLSGKRTRAFSPVGWKQPSEAITLQLKYGSCMSIKSKNIQRKIFKVSKVFWGHGKGLQSFSSEWMCNL